MRRVTSLRRRQIIGPPVVLIGSVLVGTVYGIGAALLSRIGASLLIFAVAAGGIYLMAALVRGALGVFAIPLGALFGLGAAWGAWGGFHLALAWGEGAEALFGFFLLSPSEWPAYFRHAVQFTELSLTFVRDVKWPIVVAWGLEAVILVVCGATGAYRGVRQLNRLYDRGNGKG